MKIEKREEGEEYPYVRDFMDHTMVKLSPEMPVYEALETLLGTKSPVPPLSTATTTS